MDTELLKQLLDEQLQTLFAIGLKIELCRDLAEDGVIRTELTSALQHMTRLTDELMERMRLL